MRRLVSVIYLLAFAVILSTVPLKSQGLIIGPNAATFVQLPGTVDCSGVGDSTSALQTAINSMPDHSAMVVPLGCIISLSNTISITGRVDIQFLSNQHPLNCSAGTGNKAPQIIWIGSNNGPIFNIIDSTAVNIQGFFFKTSTSNVLNSVINIDGDGSVGHQTPTENMVQYNSFCYANQSNASLKIISISATSNSNNEKYVVANNDMNCSSTSGVLRAADGVTNGTTTATSATATFVAGDVGKRIRISYAASNHNAGLIDSTVASVTNSTTAVLSAASWSGATTYSFGQLVTGSDTNLYVSETQNNLNNNPVGGPANQWLAMPSVTGATVHIGQSFGIGIYQAGGNSFHEWYFKDSVEECAIGFDLTNGSWSIVHYGGGVNDLGVNTGNSNGMIDYYDAENDMTALLVTGGPIIVREMRGTFANSMANGWIYVPAVATLTMMGFHSEASAPPANWVLYGFPTSVSQIVSINNRYDTTLTYAQTNLCGGVHVAFTNDTFKTDGTQSGYCGTNGLPTSASGLSTGMMWLNSGVLTVH